MEYRFLGKSGLRVSVLSFGAWVTFGNQMGLEPVLECMTAAFEAGVNFFDNAEVYANGQAETLMGQAIQRTGWKRSDLVLSTKIFWGGEGPNDTGLSRKHLIEGANAALKRLQTDYVDLIFCHRPDPYTPMEEIVWSMNMLLQQGKAFYWGTSEWNAADIMEAHAVARREHLVPPLMEQPEYNMLHRERVEREYAPLYRQVGLGTTIWSPLASGILTGKYLEGIPEGSRMSMKDYEWLRKRLEGEEGERLRDTLRNLTQVAQELGCSLAQLALAWCVKNPHVSTVITGATRASQVQENMASLQVVPQLTSEVMEKIETILGNKPRPETLWRKA